MSAPVSIGEMALSTDCQRDSHPHPPYLRVPARGQSNRLLSRTYAAWRRREQTMTGVLITRRSQVQILPPPPKRPGQKLLLAGSCRVRATTPQPNHGPEPADRPSNGWVATTVMARQWPPLTGMPVVLAGRPDSSQRTRRSARGATSTMVRRSRGLSHSAPPDEW